MPLLRRFIDPTAEIMFVPANQLLEVALNESARSFDAEGAEFTHKDGKCTFEVLIEDFDLGSDRALTRLAKIVHAADTAADPKTDPRGAGLLAIGEEGLQVDDDGKHPR